MLLLRHVRRSIVDLPAVGRRDGTGQSRYLNTLAALSSTHMCLQRGTQNVDCNPVKLKIANHAFPRSFALALQGDQVMARWLTTDRGQSRPQRHRVKARRNEYLTTMGHQFSAPVAGCPKENTCLANVVAPGGRAPALPKHFCIPPSNQWLSSLSFVHKRSCCFIESHLSQLHARRPLICRVSSGPSHLIFCCIMSANCPRQSFNGGNV